MSLFEGKHPQLVEDVTAVLGPHVGQSFLGLGKRDVVGVEKSRHQPSQLEGWMTALSMTFSLQFWHMVKILEAKPQRVLDVGCGPDGWVPRALAENRFFPSYIAVDMANYVDTYRNRKNMWFVQCDAVNFWPFADGSIDWVVFSEVIEHVECEDGMTFLKNISRVLRVGGSVGLTTPLKADWRDEEGDREWFGHVYYWEQEELLDALDCLGLEVVEMYPNRCLRSRVSWKKLVDDVEAKFGEGGMEIACWLKKRYSMLAAKHLLSGLVKSEQPDGVQLVAKRQA